MHWCYNRFNLRNKCYWFALKKQIFVSCLHAHRKSRSTAINKIFQNKAYASAFSLRMVRFYFNTFFFYFSLPERDLQSNALRTWQKRYVNRLMTMMTACYEHILHLNFQSDMLKNLIKDNVCPNIGWNLHIAPQDFYTALLWIEQRFINVL